MVWVSLSSIWVDVAPGREQFESNLFEYAKLRSNQLELSFSLDGFETETVTVDGIDYEKISYPGAGQTVDYGKPDLPTFSKLLAVPEGAEITYEISILDTEVLNNVKVLPQSSSFQKNEDGVMNADNDFYNNGSLFPESNLYIGSPVIMRGLNFVSVKISPFQFDPVNNQLHIIKKMSVLLNVDTSFSEISLETKYRSKAFDKLFSSNILNYDEVTAADNIRDDLYSAPVILYIHPDNSSLTATLETLLEWKREKGYQVFSASTAETGSTLSSIKNYIQNAYDNWDTPPTYICLVGDADTGESLIIPTGNMDGGAGDQYYVRLDGDDILADAIIGRLSVDTVFELQTIINKVFKYEKTPYTANTDWFENTLLIGDTSQSGSSTVITSRYIKETILAENSNFTFDEEYSSNYVNAISTSLNAGAGYFSYRGWIGMSGWGNSNTEALNNGYMLPIVNILTCDTGSFNSGEARNEVFLRTGSPSVPRGASAAIGTATSHTHTCFNNCVAGATFYSMFMNGEETIGGALAEGKMVLYANYPENPSNHTYQFSYWNNLMGDPTMKVWTEVPSSLVISADNNIAIGQNIFNVNVKNGNGQYINEAIVTLYQEDGCFSTLLTDRSGNVTLPLENLNSGDIRLTVTKKNYIPHQESLDVLQSSHLLQIADYQINDDNAGSSSGNNDSLINPGETVELSLRLKNFGTSSISGINAVLSYNGRELDIITSSSSFASISVGGEAWSNLDYVLEATNLGQDGDVVPINCTITDGIGNTWQDQLCLQIVGTDLQVAGYEVTSSGSRNLEPGQTGTMQVTLNNNGSIAASGVTGTISCHDNRINISDNTGSFSLIPAGGTGQNSVNSFELSADSQIYSGEMIQFKMAVSGDNIFKTLTFFVEFGQVQSYDPLGPDSYGYTCFDDSDAEYDLAPVYDWIEIDPNYGGTGNNLNLYDPGNTGDKELVDLPFDFRFYGISYDQITVCSNGWIVLGETEQTSFMNRLIPGSLGPHPLIAPFWDDLKTGSGRVCTKYSASDHAYIIEWSHMQNEYNSVEETFQVILYDQDYLDSPTNDGDIKFQYKVFNNVDVGAYGVYSVQHGQYSTVGIEDHSSEQGLQYTYNDIYPSAASQLENRKALLFTTRISSLLEPPEAVVDVNEFSFNLEMDQTSSQNFTLQNNGEASLVYFISKDYQDSREIVNNRDSGGPDIYGYQWKDSNEVDGPDYNWVDISAIGTLVNFSQNDAGSGLFDIGFNFNYYGVNYDQFRINPNGWIGFAGDNTAWNNTSIPNGSSPRPAIFPFWDDLHPADNEGGSGNVYYHTTAERLVIWFDNVSHWGTSSPGTYDFQTIIYPSGRIMLQYRDMEQTVTSATIGIQNATGNDGLQIAYNNEYVQDELAVLIYNVVEWVSVNPASGSIPDGDSELIDVTVNSEFLEEGSYNCNLLLYTNDPGNGVVEIPLELGVGIVPAIPGEVEIDFASTNMSLTWDSSAGASSYRIYGSNSPETGFSFLAEVIGTTWSVSPGEARKFYRVTAKN